MFIGNTSLFNGFLELNIFKLYRIYFLSYEFWEVGKI